MSQRDNVFKIVNTIPVGKVTSYGVIGTLIGISGWEVGRYLTGLPENMWESVMWHRVIAKNGHISSLKLGFRGLLQVELLAKEGVTVATDTVDMAIYGLDAADLAQSTHVTNKDKIE